MNLPAAFLEMRTAANNLSWTVQLFLNPHPKPLLCRRRPLHGRLSLVHRVRRNPGMFSCHVCIDRYYVLLCFVWFATRLRSEPSVGKNRSHPNRVHVFSPHVQNLACCSFSSSLFPQRNNAPTPTIAASPTEHLPTNNLQVPLFQWFPSAPCPPSYPRQHCRTRRAPAQEYDPAHAPYAQGPCTRGAAQRLHLT